MRLKWCELLLLTVSLAPVAVEAQTLIEFYRQALETNPALRSNEFGIEQARAQEDLALSKLLPQVKGSASHTWVDDRQSGIAARGYEGVRTDVQARQALVDLASYFKLQGARFTVSQSEQERDAARMTLGGNVVDRYLLVLQAGDEITRLLAEKDAIEAQLKRLRFMYERQLAKITDLYEVHAYYQGLLTKEIEARNARAVALERLHEVTGVRAQQVAPLARTSFPTVPGNQEQWVIDAAGKNPNLVALRNALDAAQKLIESGRAEHLPQLALTASRVYSNQGYDNRIAPPYIVGTIGLQLSIPFYEGGRVQATVREATARFGMAREKLEGARREIERDVRTAYLNASTNHARIASTNEEVRSLEMVVAERTKSYSLGASTVIDLLVAQQRLFKARSDQSKARYDYIRDLTTLRMRAGVLTMREIEEIDGWMSRAGPVRELMQREMTLDTLSSRAIRVD